MKQKPSKLLNIYSLLKKNPSYQYTKNKKKSIHNDFIYTFVKDKILIFYGIHN